MASQDDDVTWRDEAVDGRVIPPPPVRLNATLNIDLLLPGKDDYRHGSGKNIRSVPASTRPVQKRESKQSEAFLALMDFMTDVEEDKRMKEDKRMVSDTSPVAVISATSTSSVEPASSAMHLSVPLVHSNTYGTLGSHPTVETGGTYATPSNQCQLPITSSSLVEHTGDSGMALEDMCASDFEALDKLIFDAQQSSSATKQPAAVATTSSSLYCSAESKESVAMQSMSYLHEEGVAWSSSLTPSVRLSQELKPLRDPPVTNQSNTQTNVSFDDFIPMRRFIALDVTRNIHSREIIIMCNALTDDKESNNSKYSEVPPQEVSMASMTTVVMCEGWFDVTIKAGDIFNVISLSYMDVKGSLFGRNGKEKAQPPIALQADMVYITDMNGLVVVHPDVLISPTRISDSVDCQRKGVLPERIRNMGGASYAGEVGIAKHAVIEQLLMEWLSSGDDLCCDDGSASSITSVSSNDTKKSTNGDGYSRQPIAVDQQRVAKLLQRTVSTQLEAMCSVGGTDEDVNAQLSSIIVPVKQWADVQQRGLQQQESKSSVLMRANSDGCKSSGYVGGGVLMRSPHSISHSTSQAAVSSSLQPLPRTEFSIEGSQCSVHVQEIVSVEEVMFCHSLGLRGQLDMVGRSTIKQLSSLECGVNDPASTSVLLPMEIKSGKCSPHSLVAHRAQVIFYILMLRIRQNNAAKSLFSEYVDGGDSTDSKNSNNIGLLMYVTGDANNVQSSGSSNRQWKKGNIEADGAGVHVECVVPTWGEITSLLRIRNVLASSLSDASSMKNDPMPKMLRNVHSCEFCFQASECLMSHCGLEDGNAQSSGVPTLFTSLVGHLTTGQLEYFQLWNKLLDLEDLETRSKQRRIWTVSCEDKNVDGEVCSGQLNVVSYDKDPQAVEVEAAHILSFQQPCDRFTGPLASGHFPFLVGDRVVISIEGITKVMGSSSDACNDSVLATNDMEDLFIEPDISVFQNNHHMKGPSVTKRRRMDVGDSSQQSAARGASGTSRMTCLAPVDRLHNDYNVCIGHVRGICKDTISITVQSCPLRLLRSIKRSLRKEKGCAKEHSFRIDKDEISSMMPTLRGNLFKLFVKPHNPKEYVNKKASNKKRGIDGINPVASDGGVIQPEDSYDRMSRLRSLIVDLAPPLFAPRDSRHPSVHMFAPPGMSPVMYQKCVNFLINFRKSKIECGDYYPGENMFTVGDLSLKCGYFGELVIFNNKAVLPNSQVHTNTTPSCLTVYPGCHPLDLWKEYGDFNEGQQECIRNLLVAQDYVLLLGMPGTGKTCTLALAIRSLIAKGLRIMVTSYTHSAVDNLLIKLQDTGITPSICTRIGSCSSILETLHPFVLDTVKKSCTSITEFRRRMGGVRLVACTVLTAASKSALLKGFDLDWSIVDEAGQISQPAILGGLIPAKKFALVGDHHQLPPLVMSTEACEWGMNISLFKRLAEAHPSAVISLVEQYRMNKDIMLLSNTLVYENRLSCGTLDVADAVLVLPNGQDISQYIRPLPQVDLSWLYASVDPSNSVVFLNTDGCIDAPVYQDSLRNSDSDGGSLVSANSGSDLLDKPQRYTHGGVNMAEVYTIICLLSVFRRCGVPMSSVGVISPFRAQVSVIIEALQSSCRTTSALNPSSSVLVPSQYINDDIPAVSTVDKFQGRDMDIVILSTVKCQQDKIGNLLEDWRRVNVAITRAKRKLIILGSIEMMSSPQLTETPGGKVLSLLSNLVTKRGWVHNLNKDSLDLVNKGQLI